MSYVVHPFIVPDTVEERSYQTNMVAGCLRGNTLFILPTGLGKTIVALRAVMEYLPKGKVLILAPTKPLLKQHLDTFQELMVGHTVCLISGNVGPKKRIGMIDENDVIIATPQTVANDLEAGRYNLDRFSMVIYDEAHRSVGNYASVKVAQHCHKGIRSIGMTASPGASIDRIREVCINLNLSRIDARSEDDRDVSPYVHDTYIINLKVNLPDDLVAIDHLFKTILSGYVSRLISMNLMNPVRPASRGYLLEIQRTLQLRLNNGDRGVFPALALTSKSIKVLHAIMLAETQGVTPLRIYMSKLEEEAEQDNGGRSARSIVSTQEYKDIRKIVDTTNVEHPKVSRTMSIVSKILADDPKSRIMVFTQYRDTCDMMVSKLSGIPDAKVERLIGQSKEGMKQKEQVAMLDRLRAGEINVIVATSVGEEGLDIASTNAVVFYEPVPSEIRTIQRKGRTGRKNDGEVYVLIAAGTMDEGLEATSKRKEEAMRANIEKLNEELARGHPIIPSGSQSRLDRF